MQEVARAAIREYVSDRPARLSAAIARVRTEDAELLDGDVADTSFEDLGIDSLALFDTVSAIQREHGVTLAYDTFIAAKTPAQLLRVVDEATRA